jgi:hypothetical protein
MRLSLPLWAPIATILALSATGCIGAQDATRPQAAAGCVLYDGYSVPVIKGTNAFGSSSGALLGILFFIDPCERIPELKGKSPGGTLFVNSLDVPKQSFTGGFAGIAGRSTWFAIRYDGDFSAATPGNYAFELVSDDGSNLYIDHHLVIANDGHHASQTMAGTVNLGAGKHHVRVDYMQGTGDVELRLLVTPPGGAKRPFTTTL